MTEKVENIFEIDDNDSSLKSKSGGKFGLNKGTIIKLEFNPNSGKDNSPANAVDINVKIGDKEYRRRIYEITGPLYISSGKLVNSGEDGYDEEFIKRTRQNIAVIKHALKAVGVTKEQIDNVSSTLSSNSISEGMKKLADLAAGKIDDKPVDIFLEYQWEIKSGQDKTYIELPKNLKGGDFLVLSKIPLGSWKEVRDENGLRYVDDANNVHPFDRDSIFMESNKAIQQSTNSNNAKKVIESSTDPTPTPSTW